MIRALAVLLCFAGAPGLAQQSASAAAEAAQMRLSVAAGMLGDAEGADDRIAALTETVHAYEDGLAAMRDGLRQVAVRERAILANLAEREDDVAQLLGVLSSISAAPRPLLLLHPSGPAGTARAAMLLSDLTPGLQAEAAVLAATLEEIQILRTLQQSALETLEDGLSGVQSAREALSAAISNRTGLPRRYAEDPDAMQLLLASSETLSAFATGLAGTVADLGGPVPDASALRGALAVPVDGMLLHRAGEPDAAGIARPGWVVATRPGALVTAPVDATLRYRGPLLDYGTVTIIEPTNGTLMVFAGLERAFGEVGEVLPGGSPLGLMGGDQGILSENVSIAGASRSETLYIEVREGDGPVDPATWFVPM